MYKIGLTILLAAAFSLTAPSVAQQMTEGAFFDLSGDWQFAVGDDAAWKTPGSDQGTWKVIRVPGPWESQGFPEYDGYAWYRKAFKLPPALRGSDLVLHLGRIDDTDEVFVNGTFVGASGTVSPVYSTAYNVTRAYAVPSSVLRHEGENFLTIRVFDYTMGGGIVEGRIGLSPRAAARTGMIRLDGVWSFRTGDNPAWSEIDTDKEGWSNVTVPGNWEPQGHRDYDGYAWYRKEFLLPEEAEPGPYVLRLGRIDDLDETFVNGFHVGTTGSIDRARMSDDDWRKEREYEVPAEVLHFGDYNVVAVRVYDGMGGGGLYEGPHALYPKKLDAASVRSGLDSFLRSTTGQ